MDKIRMKSESRVARKYYFTGLVIFVLVTLSLLIVKISHWNTMSFWWLLLPSGIVIVGILALLLIELAKGSPRATPENKRQES